MPGTILGTWEASANEANVVDIILINAGDTHLGKKISKHCVPPRGV